MTWDEALEELSHRHTLAEAMGGEEKVARQHHFGKLTIRERIEAIVDPGSFREIGKLAGEAAKSAGIETVVFDRSGANFHGKVKALAEAAREAGLKL